MYFMHFSRHNRQQWQHFMPHFTSGLPDWLFLKRLSMYLRLTPSPIAHSITARASWIRLISSAPYAALPRW